jgi:CubicO group peptidase (beta-lactamase class C family)
VDDPALLAIAELVIRQGAAPAAAVAVAARSGSGFRWASAAAGAVVGTAPTPPLFDLASVTKPFVAVTAARLARAGMLSLDAPLGELLPELSDTPSGPIPLIYLLAHRAGLDAHRTLFAPLVARRPFELAKALREAADARRADACGRLPDAGFPALYSDLGYVLAGAALERVSGLALDALVDRELTGPLALDACSARLWLLRDARFYERVQPTETVAFRGGVVRGVVHDENAWALAGHGLAGQAGLFGTAEAVARFGAFVLDAACGRADHWLTSAEVEPLLRHRPGGSLRAGFDGKSGEASAAGTLTSAATFGHLGFTGTSLWCDPAADRVSVLLSNRVCPTRNSLRIRGVRPQVHDALTRFTERLVSGNEE